MLFAPAELGKSVLRQRFLCSPQLGKVSFSFSNLQDLEVLRRPLRGPWDEVGSCKHVLKEV